MLGIEAKLGKPFDTANHYRIPPILIGNVLAPATQLAPERFSECPLYHNVKDVFITL
jgi:hypothetical protein